MEIDSGTGTVPQGSDFRLGTDAEVQDHPAHRMAHAIHAGGQPARQGFRQPQDVELPARTGHERQPVDRVNADFHQRQPRRDHAQQPGLRSMRVDHGGPVPADEPPQPQERGQVAQRADPPLHFDRMNGHAGPGVELVQFLARRADSLGLEPVLGEEPSQVPEKPAQRQRRGGDAENADAPGFYSALSHWLPFGTIPSCKA